MLRTRHRHHESLLRLRQSSPRVRKFETRVDPFKPDKPETSIVKPAFPKGLAGCPNSRPFNVISSTIRSWSCPWTINTRSSSKVLPRPKQIVLIKVGEHYHGCNSLPGFLGKNQFCVECETGFNDDTTDTTPAKARNAPPVFKPDVPGPSPRTVVRVSLPLLSSVLLRGTMFRQPQNVLVHQREKSRSQQENQKRVRVRQEMPSMQSTSSRT